MMFEKIDQLRQLYPEFANQNDYQFLKTTHKILGEPKGLSLNDFSKQVGIPLDFDREGIGSSIKSGIVGAADWATAGTLPMLQAKIGELAGGDYNKELRRANMLKQSYETENPYSNLAGSVVGGALTAPAFTGVAGTALKGPIMAATAGQGLQGATHAVGAGLAKGKSTSDILEDAAIEGGIGALSVPAITGVGKGINAIGSGIKAAAPAVGTLGRGLEQASDFLADLPKTAVKQIPIAGKLFTMPDSITNQAIRELASDVPLDPKATFKQLMALKEPLEQKHVLDAVIRNLPDGWENKIQSKGLTSAMRTALGDDRLTSLRKAGSFNEVDDILGDVFNGLKGQEQQVFLKGVLEDLGQSIPNYTRATHKLDRAMKEEINKARALKGEPPLADTVDESKWIAAYRDIVEFLQQHAEKATKVAGVAGEALPGKAGKMAKLGSVVADEYLNPALNAIHPGEAVPPSLVPELQNATNEQVRRMFAEKFPNLPFPSKPGTGIDIVPSYANSNPTGALANLGQFATRKAGGVVGTVGTNLADLMTGMPVSAGYNAATFGGHLAGKGLQAAEGGINTAADAFNALKERFIKPSHVGAQPTSPSSTMIPPGPGLVGSAVAATGKPAYLNPAQLTNLGEMTMNLGKGIVAQPGATVENRPATTEMAKSNPQQFIASIPDQKVQKMLSSAAAKGKEQYNAALYVMMNNPEYRKYLK
jgi:hypothetical protein